MNRAAPAAAAFKEAIDLKLMTPVQRALHKRSVCRAYGLFYIATITQE